MDLTTMRRTLLAATVITAFSLLPAQSLLAHGWQAPKEEAATANPVAASDQSIAAGRKTYLQYCAMCHGPDARGNAALAASLGEEPPDLLKRLDEHSEGDMHWKIRTGRGVMPSFGETLSDTQIWDLINYIKSLK